MKMFHECKLDLRIMKSLIWSLKNTSISVCNVLFDFLQELFYTWRELSFLTINMTFLIENEKFYRMNLIASELI